MKHVWTLTAMIALSLSAAQAQEGRLLQTPNMTQIEFNQAAGYGKDDDPDSYCYIILDEPYAKEDAPDLTLARGIGDGAEEMVIKLKNTPVKVSSENIGIATPYIWHNQKANLFMVFDTTRVVDYGESSILFGQLSIITPQAKEVYQARFSCLD
ncbi:hypothetical protein J7554_02270 [Wohlfahrtiimonas chitiniclastica]|uniref:hypothetical protein n=1 Tax=Wohlfahrtiimonas chitiniclastica TaxID=400946 RepID=UPI001BCF3B05|nr:hypothetical protein [Wohlfahrtiimonas chitiniclastica]MBS7827950.1 hypothetical protein [Wohlfahrtiimonas chitiniclastica]